MAAFSATDLSDDWKSGLETLFQLADARDIATALKQLYTCCRWERDVLREPYTESVEQDILDDAFCYESIPIYFAVPFGK